MRVEKLTETGSNPAQAIRRYRETPRERFLSEAEISVVCFAPVA